ncbi:hypothetical protein AB5J55_14110 [Streptomyces sp. R11]|uniref:Uncharacterized protein n=1 Tax=Streptomyces sp. R11 TaxID=3238625 RepID=A0AB39N155_9ACTN
MMQYTAQRIWDHHGQNNSAVRLPQAQRVSPGRGTRVAGRPDECGGSTADAHRVRAPRTRTDNASATPLAALPTFADAASPDDASHHPYAPTPCADHGHDHTDRYRCVGFGPHADDD